MGVCSKNKLIVVSVSAIWVSSISVSVSVVTAITVTMVWVSISVSSITVVCRWISRSIGFGFTLVYLVDSVGGSWGAYVLVAGRSWAIKVWSITGITVGIWVVGTSIEYSWVGISGSLSTVVSMSVSVAVVWVAVSMAIISTISVSSVSKTVAIVAIVSFRGCFGFWFGNNSRDKGKGENGL